MALIDCSECGKPISDKAKACPHCGAPVSKKITLSESEKKGKGTIAAIVLLFLFILVGTIAYGIYATSTGNSGVFEVWGLTHYTDESGNEFWFNDKSGNPVRMKTPDGTQSWFDKYGNVKHIKMPNGKDIWYDEYGNVIPK